jgi:anthranilate synthase component 1
MVSLSLSQVKEIALKKEYACIPIAYEIFSDNKTSIEVLKILKNISDHCYILESVEDSKVWGRYSFLGFDPTLEITCENGFLQIKGYKTLSKQTKNPGKYIKEIINENKSPNLDNLPPFTGGLVGYFSYDYIKYSEPRLYDKLNSYSKDYESFKDVDLMLFDKIIAFDNFKQKIILIVNMKIADIEKEYEIAISKLKEMVDIIKNGKSIDDDKLKLKTEFLPLFSKQEYISIIEKAKEHIKEGDIFQIVPSNPISAEIEGSLLDTYRVLRTTNPSPYMFYFSSNDIEIAGASPETLVKLHNGTLYTFPLAGTRPRGKNHEEDMAFEKDLLSDEKELAEHNMLVDLGRNDIGKVSKLGSVKVEKYLSIERFSHVMHIGSTVSGKLRDDKDVLDVINSILPAGTLSGAPKIRACEIISDLEKNKRGIYGGAIGYIALSGNMDTCIAIRLAYKKKNHVFVRSGGGVVADSVPELEFQESLNKAAAVLDAIKIAEKNIE